MKFLYSRTSVKFLQTLQKDVVNKLIEAIEKLPFEGDRKKLKGRKVKNVFRLRIGKYRIIYSQQKDVIRIIKIDTRGDVYK
ncbi:MAG: type II toxin-antitoxin system RelE family toxin [Candidatus Aminicenantes bacterium]